MSSERNCGWMSSRELVFVGWGLSRERSEEKRRSAISSLLLPPYFHLGDLFSTTSAKVSYQQSIWTSSMSISATCLPAAWFVRRQCEMPNRYSRSSGFVSVFLVSNETALKKVFQLRGSRRKHGVATPVFPWPNQQISRLVEYQFLRCRSSKVFILWVYECHSTDRRWGNKE